MSQEKQLSDLIKEAHDLLNNNDSLFKSNKELIVNLFGVTQNIDNKENIRLAVIDSFYSTNINKSNDALSELSKELKEISNNDTELSKKFINYYLRDSKDNINNIKNLFNKEFGWKKNKETKGNKATSLISKYAYFLTGFEFPIYDSLMKEIIPNVEAYLHITNDTDLTDVDKYFSRIRNITKKLGVYVDEFDAFGWLYGKLKNAEKHNKKHISLIGDVTKYSIFYNTSKAILNIK